MKKLSVKIVVFVLMAISLIAMIFGAKVLLLPWIVWFSVLSLAAWILVKNLRSVSIVLVLVGGFIYISEVLTMISGEGGASGFAAEGVNPEAGEAIFWGKGKCHTCHSIGSRGSAIRAPNLGDSQFGPIIGLRAMDRARQREAAGVPLKTATDYLIEAVTEPGAFVVEGFKNEMPYVYLPPIALRPDEIKAVISYMQSLGGEVDVDGIRLPDKILKTVQAPQRELKGDPQAGKILFETGLQCIRCHKIGDRGGEGGVGPDLTEIGAVRTVDYIEESILDPNAIIVSGFEWTSLRLQNGEQLSGTIIATDEEKLTLNLDQDLREEDWGWDDEEEGAGASQVRIVAIRNLVAQPISSMQDLRTQGYLWIETVLNDRTSVSGIIAEEDESSLTIRSGDQLVKIAKNQITGMKGRQIEVSSKMPMYDDVITLRQFEDLVTYLASLRGATSE